MGEMSLRDSTAQQIQLQNSANILSLSNKSISLGQVFFRRFLIVNFFNQFCLLKLLIFFFSLSFCLLDIYSGSIPGFSWEPYPSSTLLNIACQMSLCIDLFYASSALTRSFFNQNLCQGLVMCFPM